MAGSREQRGSRELSKRSVFVVARCGILAGKNLIVANRYNWTGKMSIMRSKIDKSVVMAVPISDLRSRFPSSVTLINLIF